MNRVTLQIVPDPELFGPSQLPYQVPGNSFTWTVPSGVTSVTAECWGGSARANVTMAIQYIVTRYGP